MVRGLSNDHAAKIIAARGEGPFSTIEDVWLRSGVPVAALEKLADADAFTSFRLDRRQALWRVRGLGGSPLPLFAASDMREQSREPAVALTPMTAGRDVVEDYRIFQLSLRAHPLAFLRAELDRKGIIPCSALAKVKDGSKVEVAGITLIRQRPGQGNVTFLTLEDETGIANAIIWQRRFEAQRRIVMSAAMVGVKGIVQKEGAVIHIVAERLEDYTDLLRTVGGMDFPHRPGPGDGVTHPGSPDRGERGWKGHPPRHEPSRTAADPQDLIRQKTRDFH
jgi:error-prone DNA polymerase